ncbi:ATP synthase F1 subunit delta [Blattabacterium cuenoti]|uniref:ATP synthase F1 subunit delta n=1 Tax=Blattabacterium cuenoti TaxID=1653831 RepID=UPI00163B903D|nr:ATP synthase F1 subunit delta [Blattabacterium cuenoti]
MFNKKKVIQHYAKIFFEFSINNQDFIFHKVQQISFLLKNHIELNQLFYTSLLSTEKKIHIVEKLFHHFDPSILHFIKFLIIRKREYLTKKIFLKYKKIYQKNKGLLKCILISSHTLNINIQNIIIQKITKLKKDKYFIIHKIDPSIIGGFFLRIEYKEWDFSIKKQLFNIQKLLINS